MTVHIGLDPAWLSDPDVQASMVGDEFRGSESLMDPYRVYEEYGQLLKNPDGTYQYVNPELHDQRMQELSGLGSGSGSGSGSVPPMYAIDIHTWIPLPESFEEPILRGLMAVESKTGYTFWNVNITGTTLHIEATKDGSIALSALIAIIAGIVFLVAGIVFVIHDYHVVQLWDDKVVIAQERSDEVQAIEQTKQLILNSDLPPEEKAEGLKQYTEYQNQLAQNATTTGDSNTSIDWTTIAIAGVIAVALLSR